MSLTPIEMEMLKLYLGKGKPFELVRQSLNSENSERPRISAERLHQIMAKAFVRIEAMNERERARASLQLTDITPTEWGQILTILDAEWQNEVNVMRRTVVQYLADKVREATKDAIKEADEQRKERLKELEAWRVNDEIS